MNAVVYACVDDLLDNFVGAVEVAGRERGDPGARI
jgi:hypothetical protein